ncbi:MULTISPECIES: phospholipid N-methyltransferase PmtA [unclassified Rhizobium]|uniref:phospholipid N-methyltransferase PmtA n=1 Tax=unclassified Rhizobium TaxID=2613769 RepID=UPI001AD9F715|nr:MULTISPECIES: class I SAM-dependent methyltransferase [unclassified Rhizobium]MBO9096952.1 methyltransferase domain-containing protein [Rhizobium sp. L58/93]MBO9134207.1 methyltransferase domain-containing protein [Rhizobium sp. B209b/85]MBO9167191.1 methyltransferase domain-containing protein [Rhizobium sp. L245/93]MBO9183149.1 methyltransferase domain-containing protein [Rhizobium sp. E27B/91]QXZ83499.1 methyltransferase domain-containing protein [Rhizobium sp. K1/93]
MALRLKERLGKKFDEEIRFFKGMMQGPRTVGSIAPTSTITARKMASVINPHSGLPVLELGPGTGAITKAILARGVEPEKLIAIEYSTDFFNHLVKRYAGVHFINGDAFDLDKTLGVLNGQTFDCVVSGIPLLNFPMQARVALLESLLDRMPPGRPVVQISYGAVSPIIARPDRYHIKHFDFIVRNIPPAQLWIYSRG